ncbi:MAG: hypothetical protein J6S85_18365 [Methanobrevibacter sp.]|nr:hypothetical protein [Methanobrevibacter sp.]
MSGLVIALIMVERIAIAVIGLVAAIYGQVWWSIFMGAILMILIASSDITVKVR